MKAYISLAGFDTSQIVSLIVKCGIAGGDKIILIRPLEDKDVRGEAMIQAVRDLSKQIDSTIYVDIHRVDHKDFEGMVLSLINLIKNTPGDIIANISGGPREIFLAFTIASLFQAHRIKKTTNYSDIDRVMNEITLPDIGLDNVLDYKQRRILKDILEYQPTTITDIAKRLKISESTISRQVNKLIELKTLDAIAKGKIKELRITLAGRLLI